MICVISPLLVQLNSTLAQLCCVKLKVLHYSLCLSQEAHSEAYLALFTGAC